MLMSTTTCFPREIKSYQYFSAEERAETTIVLCNTVIGLASKRLYQVNIFSYFSTKTFVVGTH